MKFLFLGLFFSVSSLFLQAEEIDSHELWMDLSAKCQNVARGLATVGPHTDPDSLEFSPDLVAIDVLLDKLVEKKELVRIEMQLKNPAEWTEKTGPELIGFVKSLSEKYGFYVASEMMSLGFRLELEPIADDQPLELVLRIPEETGKKFQTFIKNSGLLADGE